MTNHSSMNQNRQTRRENLPKSRPSLPDFLAVSPTKTVIPYPAEVLRRGTFEVPDPTHPKVDALIKAMNSAVGARRAAGLAAPQLGVSAAIIVVNGLSGSRTLINPKIVDHGVGQYEEWEGCLSLPGFRAKVRRFNDIEVSALNGKGKEVRLRASGWDARVLQHELDHLRGVLMTDRAQTILPDWVFTGGTNKVVDMDDLDMARSVLEIAQFTDEREAMHPILTSVSKVYAEDVEEAMRQLHPEWTTLLGHDASIFAPAFHSVETSA